MLFKYFYSSIINYYLITGFNIKYLPDLRILFFFLMLYCLVINGYFNYIK